MNTVLMTFLAILVEIRNMGFKNRHAVNSYNRLWLITTFILFVEP